MAGILKQNERLLRPNQEVKLKVKVRRRDGAGERMQDIKLRMRRCLQDENLTFVLVIIPIPVKKAAKVASEAEKEASEKVISETEGDDSGGKGVNKKVTCQAKGDDSGGKDESEKVTCQAEDDDSGEKDESEKVTWQTEKNDSGEEKACDSVKEGKVVKSKVEKLIEAWDSDSSKSGEDSKSERSEDVRRTRKRKANEKSETDSEKD